jgi:hypothetical protein
VTLKSVVFVIETFCFFLLTAETHGSSCRYFLQCTDVGGLQENALKLCGTQVPQVHQRVKAREISARGRESARAKTKRARAQHCLKRYTDSLFASRTVLKSNQRIVIHYSKKGELSSSLKYQKHINYERPVAGVTYLSLATVFVQEPVLLIISCEDDIFRLSIYDL